MCLYVSILQNLEWNLLWSHKKLNGICSEHTLLCTSRIVLLMFLTLVLLFKLGQLKMSFLILVEVYLEGPGRWALHSPVVHLEGLG